MIGDVELAIMSSRGNAGGRRVSAGARAAAMSHKEFGQALAAAIQKHGTSAGYAHVRDLQAEFKANYGMNKQVFNDRLNAARVAGESGKSPYTLHYEEDEENWRNHTGKPADAALIFRGRNFDFVELMHNGKQVGNEAAGMQNPRFSPAAAAAKRAAGAGTPAPKTTASRARATNTFASAFAQRYGRAPATTAKVGAILKKAGFDIARTQGDKRNTKFISTGFKVSKGPGGRTILVQLHGPAGPFRPTGFADQMGKYADALRAAGLQVEDRNGILMVI